MSLRKTVRICFFMTVGLSCKLKKMSNIKFPKFIITKAKNGEYMFNLWSVNGRIILTSETYTQKQNCIKGIESVQNHADEDKNYDRKTAKNGNQYYFNLKARNGQIIGKSEMYGSVASRDNGIEAVKRDAPKAETEDLS